jgi:hypothetical protein
MSTTPPRPAPQNEHDCPFCRREIPTKVRHAVAVIEDDDISINQAARSVGAQPTEVPIKLLTYTTPSS